jgi:ABC-2 type transport system ATP-binding protein
MAYAIHMSAVTKWYGARRGIESIELAVPEGTILGFLGPNGAGKTTTIRVLLGLLRPTSGRALILGKDCWSEGQLARQDVGYVPGDLRLYPWLSARSAVRLAASIRGTATSDSAKDLLHAFGLEPDLPVRRMSRGTRQKLGLVLALAHAPRVIVLDEPTTSLDPLVSDALYGILSARAEAGATVFFSSHTLGEVERLCERIAIVRDGRIVADEPLAEIRARATRAVMIRFHDADTAAATRPPDVLQVRDRTGDIWHAELTGEPAAILDFLQRVQPADFTIGAPDLQGIFRSHYGPDAGAGASRS